MYTHPRSGAIMFFGANSGARDLMTLTASYAQNIVKIHFFDEEHEAWTLVRSIIAEDTRVDMP